MPSIVIVVPCFNEAKRLRPEAFLQALRLRQDMAFLFVDDGSNDGTGALLAEMCATAPSQVRTLPLGSNRGKAEAIRQGFLKALGSGARIIGYWDADLATPLGDLTELLVALEDPRTRVVIGSRVKLLGRRIERRPLRHYLGRVFATAASMALQLRVYDTQCGAKLFRRTPELETCFSEPFRSRWIFDVEILARLRDLNPGENGGPEPDGWVEVPLREWRDISGTKVRLAAFARAPFELLRIALRHWMG